MASPEDTTGILHAYDYLKSGVKIPLKYSDLNDALKLKGKDELRQIHLNNAHRALKALKTKPANENKAELAFLAKSLTPLMAYALSDPNPQLRAHAVAQLKPMFNLFSDTYSTQYSKKALKDKVENEELTPDQADAFEKTREALKAICKNEDLAKTARLMQDFLLKINFDQHPALLNLMVKALSECKRENLNNLERTLENYGNSSFEHIKAKSHNTHYAEDWRMVGIFFGNAIIAAATLGIAIATNTNIPLDPIPGSSEKQPQDDYMAWNRRQASRPKP